ncbi:hypothetical protein C9885_29790, partial [Klebsiella pneumoniae]
RRHPFEGVLHNMERRYKETESSAVRERAGEVHQQPSVRQLRRHPFEGVLHNMERRYKETESSAVRERAGEVH